jgi:hypothetical protein
MSKRTIEKNIRLSLDFDTFVSRNPRVLNKIPKGAHIIFVSHSDKNLTQENLQIAKNSKSSKFFIASKNNSKWRVAPLSNK